MAVTKIETRHGLEVNDLYGMKCGIYRNLTRNCYSVKAMEGELKGKVVAHLPLDMEFTITGVGFKVSETVRQRVVTEGKKYVHAYAVGRLSLMLAQGEGEELYYNPFKCKGFMLKSTPELGVLTGAYCVTFRAGRLFAHNIY